MKKVIRSVAAMLVVAVMLAGCNGGGPKANAEKFLNGLYHMDYAAAKEVSDSNTVKQLEAYESIMGTMLQQSAKDEAKKLKIDIKAPKVTGDDATVEYIVSNDPSPKTLKMAKVKGKWLVQWSKMDMGGGGMGGNTGAGNMNGGGMAAPDTMMAPPADGPMSNGNGTPTPPQNR